MLDFQAFRFSDGRDAATDAGLDGTDDLGTDAGVVDDLSDASSTDVSIADVAAIDIPPIDTPPIDVPPPPPPRSCADHLRAGRTTSGLYAIDPDGDPATALVTVFCDQVREGGGWQRVFATLDGVDCPPVLAVDTRARLCVRRFGPGETVSAFLVTPEVAYSEVRGRAAFRGWGDLDGFDNPVTGPGADELFVDGLTVSRVLPGDGGDGGDGGAAREHVFTWRSPSRRRPRVTAAYPRVGDRHLCRAIVDRSRDAGAPFDGGTWRDPESPWFGASAPCAAGDVNGWFRTALATSTRAPLDVRLIVSGTSRGGVTSENVGIAALELYVR